MSPSGVITRLGSSPATHLGSPESAAVAASGQETKEGEMVANIDASKPIVRNDLTTSPGCGVNLWLYPDGVLSVEIFTTADGMSTSQRIQLSAEAAKKLHENLGQLFI